MKQSTRGPTVAAAIGVLIAFVALACKIGQPARPTVTLLFPAGNAQVTVNRPLEVQSISAGQAGIERVELRVNGQPVDTTPGGGQQTFTALQPWTPPSEGRYTLQVQAFDTAGGQSDLASVTVTALQPTAEPLAAATAIPTPAAPATDTPPPPPTPTDTSGPAMLVAKTDLNVRAGPSTQFEVVGLLRGGQSAPIIGVNAAGTWWLIAFPGAPKGQGWSSANPEYSAAPDPNRVPVVSAPPFPPTATPTARLDFPTIHYFKADRLTISRGQSALLQWDVSGAEAVYLYPGGEGGVIAPGSVHVSPAATTTYRLVAQNSRGQIEAALTINVRPAITAPRRIFDFIAAGPDAAWQNSHGAELPWNGPPNDPRGFVIVQQRPTLEDDSRPALALQTHPEWILNGRIEGNYALDFTVKSGDRFAARVGFLKGAEAGTGVTFQFCFFTFIEQECLGQVVKTYNGRLLPFEVDLSPLNGYNSGWFQLRVDANGSAEKDWAVWINPRIERPQYEEETNH